METINLNRFEVWFVSGSQFLYGEETLREVAEHSGEIARELDASGDIPVSVLFKGVLKTAEEIYQVCMEASREEKCIGIITWMHTFSPAKMWIRGLKVLHKPLLHLHSQFNQDIPWSSIDMDFMNLNQSAHGDREFGFLMSRMRISRKVVVGHWRDRDVQAAVGTWCRAACGWHDLQGARYCRFGDNMRNVAVTEGDKVEAEIRLGYSVNGFGMGDLAKSVRGASDADVDRVVKEYDERYQMVSSLREGANKRESLRDAARIEVGLTQFLETGGFKGFTDTFEDLEGLEQLPGIAVQRLMNRGYGFGAEGDWKTAALVRAMKVMASGLKGGNTFMEDYTYHLDPGNSMVLGAHMLEICESIASEKPSCEVHPLGIGGKADPVRLVFGAAAGNAINVAMIDLGDRFRLLVNEVKAVKPPHEMPKLPVAHVLWKPYPDFKRACASWILAGGAHHTCYSQNLSASHIRDFAEMCGIEVVQIGKETELDQLRNQLRWNEEAYRQR